MFVKSRIIKNAGKTVRGASGWWRFWIDMPQWQTLEPPPFSFTTWLKPMVPPIQLIVCLHPPHNPNWRLE
jgi:hypothetical protein